MKITKGFKKLFHYRFMLLLVASFMMGQSAFAQDDAQITASGVVVNADGPMIGVNVAVPGTTIGTITGLNGDFSLPVPKGSTLQFSFMGYTTVSQPAGPSMRVTLSDGAIDLDLGLEVKGIGYGTMTTERISGSVESLKDINAGSGTSSEQILQGKIAGLTVVKGTGDPTKGSTMRLRGGTSLSGNNSPLVVVDGIANVDMNTVQPSDIVSVDVLKDASATAIYGSRGANGVIIVTTNRKETESNTAEYAGYIGISKVPNRGKLDLLTAGNWSEVSDDNNGADTDWQDEILQTAITQSHSLTFASSSKKGGFKGSIAYLNAEGVVKTTELERISASVSGYTKVWDDRLRLEAGVHTNRDDYSDLDGYGSGYTEVFYNAYKMNPTTPVTGYKNDPPVTGTDYSDGPAGQTLINNPVEYLNTRHSDNTRDRLLTFAKAELSIIEGLKGTVNISMNTVGNRTRYSHDIDSRLSSNARQGGFAKQDQGQYTEKQFEGFFNYDIKSKNQIHNFGALAGYSYSDVYSDGLGAGTTNFRYDDWKYNNLSGGAGNYASGQSTNYSYSYASSEKLISFFGRVNYSYAGRYLATATIRHDGSSKFGENHKWGTFPSLSVGWRITEEQFMIATKSWLDDAKLRVGYGITGNQGGIGAYNSVQTSSTSDPMGGGTTVEPERDEEGNPTGNYYVKMYSARNANADLKWESTGQLNVGLDFTLSKIFSGTFEFYHKKTSDLLYSYKLGSFYYPQNKLMNVGNLVNTGVEFTLNADIMDRENFFWSASVNLAHNKNEVTKIANPDFPGTDFHGGPLDVNVVYAGLTGKTNTQILREGYSVGSFFGAKTAGVNENGEILYKYFNEKTGESDVTTNIGDLSNEEREQYLGNAMPKLTMGLNMNFKIYKNIDVSIGTYGMFGQKVYNATKSHMSTAEGGGNILESALGKNYEPAISDFWLEDASFFRLQNITVGYTFNLEKIKMNRLRIYATIENLFVITDYSGVDPEVSIDMNLTQINPNNNVYPGIDNFNNYPKPITYMFGLNLTF